MDIWAVNINKDSCDALENEQNNLKKADGTSYSTPLVAGSVALIRQYFMDGYYPSGGKHSQHSFTPSGSLLKAMVIAGQYGCHLGTLR